MRQSKLFLNTLREVPADADVLSHQLMLRAGLIRQLTSGVYSFLPLGMRVLQKIEQIVREEMNQIGSQEVYLPAMQPAELWQESGRWDDYGVELIRFQDRHERLTVLGPTHEEVITRLVQNEVKSYRQLPFTLYQIQTKFRDERRPRAGLLRGREFRMKDAYSFHADEMSLDATYQDMYKAYCRVFDRMGVDYRAVDADPGAIGGNGGTHEFMVMSLAGEDTIACCTSCSYAANLEKANGQALAVTAVGCVDAKQTVSTPRTKRIDDLVKVLGVSASQIIKVIVYRIDDKLVAVVLCGNHEVNEVKLKNFFDARQVEIASAADVFSATGRPVGFVGPDVNLPKVFDRDVLSITDGVAATAGVDEHDIHVVPGRDFEVLETANIRNVIEGDICFNCGGTLQFHKGIEVGHIFKLGTKYSSPLGASFIDEAGVSHAILMGCYGLGTSRVIPAVIEQCHDENGIIWPLAIAPYAVHIVPVSTRDDVQVKAAESLYHRLVAAGISVLLDDRDERPGVKFKDADLLGMPMRVTIGNKIAEGNVEFKVRKTNEVIVMSLEQAFQQVLNTVN